MNYTFTVALRYLRAGRRDRFLRVITAIAAVGVAFGTAALLIALSVISGFEATLRSSMVAFTGHIEVTSIKGEPVADTALGLIRATPEVHGVSPFVARQAIVRSGSGLEGVRLKGVNPSLEVSAIGRMMVDGKFAFPGTEGDTAVMPIILGARLAGKLRIKRGDTLVVFAPEGVPSPDNPPTVRRAVLTGTYRTGMAEYDDLYAYTSIPAAQSLFEMARGKITGYDVIVGDIDRSGVVARSLDERLGYPYYSRTVFEMFQSIFAWLDLQRRPIPIVLGLIVIVAVFNILSTLLMVVLEKTESIGVLGTLGATPGGIVRIFVGQGVLIGAAGTLAGCAVSLAFIFLQTNLKLLRLNSDIYFVDSVPVALVAWHYGLVIAVAISLSILSTLIPAFVASRLRPVDALRFR